MVAGVSGKPRPGRFVSARKAPLGEGSALPRYGTAARAAARRSTARRRGSRPRGAPSKGLACAAFPRSSSAAGRRASPRPALRVSPTPRGRGGDMPGRLRNADMGGSERVRAAPISWPRRTCRRSPAPAPPIPLRHRGARRPCVLPGCTGRSAGTVAAGFPALPHGALRRAMRIRHDCTGRYAYARPLWTGCRACRKRRRPGRRGPCRRPQIRYCLRA